MEEIRVKGGERDTLRNTCNQLNVYIHDTLDEVNRVQQEQVEYKKETEFVIE